MRVQHCLQCHGCSEGDLGTKIKLLCFQLGFQLVRAPRMRYFFCPDLQDQLPKHFDFHEAAIEENLAHRELQTCLELTVEQLAE